MTSGCKYFMLPPSWCWLQVHGELTSAGGKLRSRLLACLQCYRACVCAGETSRLSVKAFRQSPFFLSEVPLPRPDMVLLAVAG